MRRCLPTPACLALALAGLAGFAPAVAFAAGESDRLRLFVQEHLSGVPARVEVTVGQPDPRLALAPCQRSEPFVPAGARLWGRSFIGLRCAEGARWSITVPVDVRVFGPALVATRQLAANQPVLAGDVTVQEVELSREGGPVHADAASLAGRQLVRTVAAGMPLRTDYFRAAPVIAQGDAVRVVARGPGFSVSTDALALAHAGDGQSVRVRTDSGRVVTGIARPGRVVEVPMSEGGAR